MVEKLSSFCGIIDRKWLKKSNKAKINYGIVVIASRPTIAQKSTSNYVLKKCLFTTIDNVTVLEIGFLLEVLLGQDISLESYPF